ncbi:hypothetical protein BCEN4_1050011 [Burkholderia cenocepacia]|nr:hypothetical protein BCEN4_1050011 [Burkholderia cenocepacia]
MRRNVTQKTKHCPTPPSLPDYNADIDSFSTDRKLTAAFTRYGFVAQTIAKSIQTFYRDILPPPLIPIH